MADEMRVVLVACSDGKRILRIDTFENIADVFSNAFGRYTVSVVIRLLLFAPPVGFIQRVLQ